MNRHKVITHNGVDYECDQCDFKGTTTSKVDKHKVSTHNEVKHEFDQFDYKATFKSHSKSHKLGIHENVNLMRLFYPSFSLLVFSSLYSSVRLFSDLPSTAQALLSLFPLIARPGLAHPLLTSLLPSLVGIG